MKNIDTDSQKIEELLTRGISGVYPDKDSLKELLQSGKRIRAYLGMDATGPDLHLGHVSKLIIMEKLRRLGHEVIILFGDFTAMVGDPSDKEAARKQLTPQQVDENLKDWRVQVSKIVDLDNSENPAKILKNSEWLSPLGFEEILNLSSHFTVQQMIERDMFDKRIKEEKPVYLHEFLYPLMQGYDSVAMEVDLEVGGSDQIFNMLAGRTLLRKLKNKEKYVLASELLEDPESGKKMMSKSEGGYIPIKDEPAQMFGEVMALPDGVIAPFLRDTTFMSLTEVERIEKELKEDANPRDKKMELAEEIVSMCHSSKEAKEAKEEFINTFQNKGVPEEIEDVYLKEGRNLPDALIEKGIISSKTELNRLLEERAVKNMDTGEKINTFSIKENCVLKIGKKRFIRVVVE